MTLPRLPDEEGLIPAHAGKTAATSRTTTSLRAHPRSRGENGKSKLTIANELGSSPLTRGKRTQDEAPPTRSGLIPAHAGKTWWLEPIRCVCRAHPRSRGENHRIKSVAASVTWLIPAHAGKTR